MTAAQQPLIRLDDVNKVYITDEVETHALNGVHLEINAGEYVAIAGPSGCGKTTLLSLLGLLDTPSDGEYLLANESVAGVVMGGLKGSGIRVQGGRGRIRAP